MPTKRNYVLVAPLIVALLVTLASGSWAWRHWAQGKASLDWPVTLGTVHLDDSARQMASFRKGDGVHQDDVVRQRNIPLDIRVNYQVDGTDFVREWNHYVSGEEVQVYYDPADPGNAVLERGLNEQSFTVGMVGFGIGLLFSLGLAALLAFPQLATESASDEPWPDCDE